jgi:hypothetical protein
MPTRFLKIELKAQYAKTSPQAGDRCKPVLPSKIDGKRKAMNAANCFESLSEWQILVRQAHCRAINSIEDGLQTGSALVIDTSCV